MRILGIDPGTDRTGFGVIDEIDRKAELVECGTIRIKGKGLGEKLKFLFLHLSKLIEEFSPDVVAIEDIYYHKNLKSAIALAHVRGVIILVAANHDIEIHEYSPAFVRKTVVGYGGADKEQVRSFVKAFLSIEEDPLLDSCDALCVALCHMNSYRGNPLMGDMRGGRGKNRKGAQIQRISVVKRLGEI